MYQSDRTEHQEASVFSCHYDSKAFFETFGLESDNISYLYHSAEIHYSMNVFAIVCVTWRRDLSVVQYDVDILDNNL